MAQGQKSEGPCSVDICTKDARTNGMCKNHAEKARRAALPFVSCSLDGCEKDSRHGSQGMCGMHYGRSKRSGTPDDSALKRIRGGRELRPCVVEGCESIENINWAPHCSMHGSRLKRHGDATTVKQVVKAFVETAPADPGIDCMPYWGTLTKRGYGQYRAIWTALRGPIPKGMHVDHICRFMACMNVNHMDIVSPEENYRRKKAAHDYIREHGQQSGDFWLQFFKRW